MSDAFWQQFFGFLTPVMLAIVAGWFGRRLKAQDQKLESIEKLSNSMLTHTTEKKEEAEHKLEQVKADTVMELKTKLAEAEKTIALLTSATKKE